MSGSDHGLLDCTTLIEADNARLKQRFLAAFETFSAADVIEMAGSGPEGTAEVERWAAERRVFSVRVEEEARFPAFQFTGGSPRPVIGQVLAILGHERTPWAIAFWFVSSDSWIGGPTPLTLLDSNPAGLLEGARHELDEIGG